MNIEKIVAGAELSKNEQQVLAYLVAQIAHLEGLKIRQVAKENYTSTSTVMRLAKKLGYSGFAELLYHLKAHCNQAQRIAQPDAQLDAERLAAFLQGHNLLVYGQGFSELVAEYIYKKLLVLGMRCWFIQTLEFETVLKNFNGTMDAILIVSKSGKTPYLVKTAQKAHENGMPVAVITGDALSELSKAANLSITVPDDQPLDDENALANRFFGNVILLFEQAIQQIQLKEWS